MMGANKRYIIDRWEKTGQTSQKPKFFLYYILRIFLVKVIFIVFFQQKISLFDKLSKPWIKRLTWVRDSWDYQKIGRITNLILLIVILIKRGGDRGPDSL